MEAFMEQQIMFFVRILLACFCGGLIGIERQHRIKVAGTRTHVMIALASALMMLISKYGFTDVVTIAGITCDVSRVAASIITGVGILCGGIFIVGKRGSVNGLTTAAGGWVTIGIGMAFGAGMYAIGIGTTILVLLLQFCLNSNLWIVRQPIRVQVTFHFDEENRNYEKLIKKLESQKIDMHQFAWERKNKNAFLMKCQLLVPSSYDRDEIVALFTGMPEVEMFEIIGKQ